MFLLAGLGNPGKKYAHTRHNVGYMFLDFLIKQLKIKTVFSQKKDFLSEIVIENLNGCKIIFLKPQTYMNRSGSAIKKVMQYYRISLSNILVFHDDLDIPFGKFRIDLASGPRQHNGINSVEQALASADFYRLRIGVDNRQGENTQSGEDYVLSNFTLTEKKIIERTFVKILSLLNREYSLKFPVFGALS